MNLDKAQEAYRHDPQYHHLVEMLMNQIETLEMSPSEIREAAMFACILIEQRSTHPFVMLDRAEMERLCMSTGKFKAVGASCTECFIAIGPSEDGLCHRCRVAKIANAIEEANDAQEVKES